LSVHAAKDGKCAVGQGSIVIAADVNSHVIRMASASGSESESESDSSSEDESESEREREALRKEMDRLRRKKEQGRQLGTEKRTKTEKASKDKTKKHGGLRDSNGARPGKGSRARYQALVASLQDMVRQNPSLSLESFPLPQYVIDNEILRAKLVARVEAARPAIW